MKALEIGSIYIEKYTIRNITKINVYPRSLYNFLERYVGYSVFNLMIWFIFTQLKVGFNEKDFKSG